MTSATPRFSALILPLLLSGFIAPACAQTDGTSTPIHTGKSSFHDWTQEKPGEKWKTVVADLPAPNEPESVDNGPTLVPRPEGAWPHAPAGFKVELYATGSFREPRLIRTAPNGDLFVADSHGDKIMVLRGVGPDGKAQTVSTFASGLNLPFGIAFYPSGPNPRWIYVGNTDSVVRIPYKSGDLVATGKPETVVSQLPGFAQLRGGGHWTRDIVFTPDGTKMLVSVGSASNVDDVDTHPNEFHRADVLEFTPEGKFVKVYASGIRNCVGEAINPTTSQLWCSTNERDRLGDNLVPDYITSVKEDGFYGWPWYYIGAHQDPRHAGKHPELKDKTIVPDVLLQPHNASLQITFYDGAQFPAEYQGDIFAAEHGSWNRSVRAGYEVIRVPRHGTARASGEYQDFMTGFVLDNGDVWGRPVG
ncbi:MAG TPA: PQQ-dependent sugar dehydrogenase, partial [Edaphobacter sp.]